MAEKGFLTVLICLFSFCGQPFKLVNSTSQEYFAGRKESGGGIKYRIEVVASKSSKKLTFDNLLVGGKELQLRIQDTQKKNIKKFGKGDTLMLSATLRISSDEIQNLNAEEKNKALLNYHFKKNERVAVVVPKRLENINYP